uniref:Small EDRK-rich factor-like N-terminal domain-containing protein n=1 Tax=Piliocolobus tephrosceles TaxID=591936 RepID=A0A8C9GH92_9PRIM
MTRGNQRELARQKNMKKQSDSVKGKRRDDGLSAAARKQSAPSSLPPGTRRSCSRSRKRQTRRRRNPSSFVASCPTLLPFACVPGASPTTLAFPPVVLTGPFCASFPSGSLSPPGPLPGVRGLPLPSVFYSCGAHPKVLKVAL